MELCGCWNIIKEPWENHYHLEDYSISFYCLCPRPCKRWGRKYLISIVYFKQRNLCFWTCSHTRRIGTAWKGRRYSYCYQKRWCSIDDSLFPSLATIPSALRGAVYTQRQIGKDKYLEDLISTDHQILAQQQLYGSIDSKRQGSSSHVHYEQWMNQ